METLAFLTVLTLVSGDRPDIICGIVDNGTHLFRDYSTDVLSCGDCEQSLCQQSEILDYKDDSICYWNHYKQKCLSGKGSYTC